MARKRRTQKEIMLSEGKRKAIQAFIDEYDLKDGRQVQDALKDLLGDTIKALMESEMEQHIGNKYETDDKRDNYRNGYKTKKVRSNYGEFELAVPQDRNSTFNPVVLPKREKDISKIDNTILSMYARGSSTKEISDVINEIYGFEIDESFVSSTTDKILPIAQEWQARPLERVYPIVFIDATHFSVREDGKVSKKAAYVILGVDLEGRKDVLSIEIGDNENSRFWLGVLNNLKNRGVKDILILCSDRLKGIKEAIETAYPSTQWQGCIVHMIRNTLKYVNYKDKNLQRI